MRRHARATPELHGAVRSGTVGRGPNRDHRPWTGRGGLASTHAHLGTAGRETTLGIAGCTLAGGAARAGAGNYSSSHARLGTAGRETILGIAGCALAGGAARAGAGNYSSSHARLGTAGRETILGIAGCGRAGGAARLGADLHVYACPPAPPWHRRPRESAGPARGPWAAAACGRAGGAV
jgi:hypothetical protein